MGNIERFLDFLKFEKHYSNNTITSYLNDLSQCNNFLTALGQTFESAKPNDLRAWIVSLMENNIEPSSIQRKISSIKAFYKYLNRENKIAINPARKLLTPKKKLRLPSYVDEKNIMELFNSVKFTDDFKGQRDKLVLSILFATGIRLSELINLTLSDIDLKACTIKVFGKRQKERIVPFGKIIKEEIESYLKWRQQENNTPYLILTDSNKKAYPKLIYRIVNKYLSKITSLDKKSPHVLRHTFATILLNKGADLNAIKELLGQANLAATQVYTHNSFEQLKNIYVKSHPRS